MVNERIKIVVKEFLEKNNLSIDDDIDLLFDEVIKIKEIRNNINQMILDTKISIIKSNSHLLIERIFKGNEENVLDILKNTRDYNLFFEFIEKLDSLLVEYGKYSNNYYENSEELNKLKESYFLTDDDLFLIISEIRGDIKK
jgi:hypothetical protein